MLHLTNLGQEKVKRNITLLYCTFLVCAITAGIPRLGSAADQEYLQMLQIAQKKVSRIQALQAPAHSNALSTLSQAASLGLNLDVGDQWDVLSCKIKSNSAAKTSETTHFRNFCGIFHYEVTRIQSREPRHLEFKVTQKGDSGLTLRDPKLESIEFSTNDQLQSSHPIYHFKQMPLLDSLIRITHSASTALEFYPLALPDFSTAEYLPASKGRIDLSPELEKAAEMTDLKTVNLANSIWLEQQDLFGRPIQALWQVGDPWPSYLKTPQGIALLIHKSSLKRSHP